MIAVDGGDVDVLAAVVIVVGDCNAHSVDLDIQAASGGDVGEGAVAIVVIEPRERFAAVRSPILRVDQQNVGPAVAVGVEEGYTRAHGFRQIFLAGFSGVVVEFDSGGG